ncbi:hypothetical protein E2C01_035445 [Portunus trituberculatus]|uniref:Uncharacterized protein n=1 Tax=Portunus trituberculatus TaxID=210409 RepID=A0A5B7F9S5_PORTR|nr:hypothetical protein [Portunus trituberculatus]
MYTETASAPASGSDLRPGPQGHEGQSVLRVPHSAAAAGCRHDRHHRSDSSNVLCIVLHTQNKRTLVGVCCWLPRDDVLTAAAAATAVWRAGQPPWASET